MENEIKGKNETIEKIRKIVLNNIKEYKMMNTVEISKTEFLTNKDGLDIYRVEETIKGKDKVELFFMADERENITHIGGRVEKTSNEIVPTQIGVDTLKEKNISFDVIKEEIERSIEERGKQLEAIAKELGMTKEEIDSLYEIDLEQKINDKQEENDKENENDKEKEEDKKEDEEEKKNEISKEKINKIGLRNEINTNVVVDERGKTLGDKTGLNRYTKLCIVHSYKLNELTKDEGEKGIRDNIPYELVGQKPDGSYERIPEVTKEPGSNKKNMAIEENEKIETKNDECVFRIAGNEPTRLIIRDEDPYGRPRLFYGKTSRDNDGIISEKVQDSEKGTERTKVEIRTLFNDNRGIDSIKDGKNELEQHPENEEKGVKEADGNPNTGHVHFDPENKEHQNAVKEIVKEGKVSEETAKAMLIKELEKKKDKDISIEEATKNVVSEIEGQYKGVKN